MQNGCVLAFSGSISYDVKRIQEIADKLHAVPCFTIHEKPTDFPNNVVVRCMFAGCSNGLSRITCDNIAIVVNSVAEARKIIPIIKMGLTLFPRNKNDVQSLVETWM